MPRIAAGEREALRAFYEATSSKLFAVCLRILSDREEAQDVLQEVYLTVWRRAGRYDPARASVGAWTATIARNRAIDRLRARGPLARAEPVDELELADDQASAETVLAAADDAARLHACLDELDARSRAAIRTAFFEGVTYEALARRLDAPPGTVKSWIRRGLARLKGCLER